MSITLYGFRPSVYVRAARLALAEKGVAYDLVEVDPFAGAPDWYADLHPFGRIPALDHDGFRLHETRAITGYVDAAFDGPPLTPPAPRERARMEQIIGMVDAYGYRPMVWQVFVERISGPRHGRPTNEEEVRVGLQRSRLFLTAVERIIPNTGHLVGDRLSLADLHLAPMVAPFVLVEEGATMLGSFSRLSAWWHAMQDRRSMSETAPPPAG